LWGFAQERNAVGDWVLERKHHEEICQRVLPIRLRDIYQRGQGIRELKDSGSFNVEEVYQEGDDAGIYDSFQPLHSVTLSMELKYPIYRQLCKNSQNRLENLIIALKVIPDTPLWEGMWYLK
jgi:hypothetical protein